MPHCFEVTVPRPGLVFLAGSNQIIAILHVNDGVIDVGEDWDSDPEIDFAGGRIVALDLMAQLAGSGGIGSKDDVVAVGILGPSAIGHGRQEAVSTGDQYREVTLVSI